MTIFFSKRTGTIKAVFSGELQHIGTVYGAESEDYALIWDEIEIPDDNDVINKFSNYRVNVETRQLEMLPTTNSYPMAQI